MIPPLPSTASTRAVAVDLRSLGKTMGERLSWPLLLVALLSCVYLVPGLVGHDPWKQDETYGMAIIQHIDQTQDWVIPMSAGRPFMEKPPLYFVVADQTARLLSPWFPLQDGARLSNLLWMSIVLVCLGEAGRRVSRRPRDVARVAAQVTLLGCVGLVAAAHTVLVDVALLAGFAMALLGFCIVIERPLPGGVLIGLGAALGFMAKGLLAPGTLAVTGSLLPLAFTRWRRSGYYQGLAIAALVLVPLCVVWPTALYLRDRSLFNQWLWQQNFGRFFGYAHLGANAERGYYAWTLLWFAFPALPLALWGLWQRRATWRDDPPLQACIVLALVTLAVLSVAGSMRANYLLPVLLPLAIIAGAELDSLPEAAMRWSFGMAAGIFGAIAIALWGICLVVAVNGSPPDWIPLGRVLPLDAIPRADTTTAAFAACVTVAWIVCMWRLRRSNLRGAIGWTLGLTLTWVLLATLWLPWINQAKSYRATFEDMQRSLPAAYDCMASFNLGESEAAMLQYHAGIVARPLKDGSGAQCSLLLTQGTEQEPPAPHGAWLGSSRAIWTGHRAGDTKQLFVVYQR